MRRSPMREYGLGYLPAHFLRDGESDPDLDSRRFHMHFLLHYMDKVPSAVRELPLGME